MLLKKLPSFSQWKQLPKILNKKEKTAILVFFVLALSSLAFLSSRLYLNITKIVPAFGGTYIEGLAGQPRFINPIYGETNDVDRDIIELIFSGLMTYDKEGKIVNDLTKEYKVSESGKIYEFTLKENIFWHDGKPLTADDVVFTIKTIQNPDYKSPLRTTWFGVEVEKLSQGTISLKLKNPYSSFLENATVKIIPKHIWQDIPPESFALSFYNLRPIGSGPFKFKGLKQNNTGFIDSLDLEANLNYYRQSPFISQISFRFFEEEKRLIDVFNKGEIDGFSSSLLQDANGLKKEGVVYSYSLPRYFAVFFNSAKSKVLAEKEVRQALHYAVDKTEITRNLNPKSSLTIRPVDSPFLSDFYGYNSPKKTYEFNPEKAKELLEKAGYKEKEGNIREKVLEKKPAFQFKSSLASGSRGKEVEELQKCLAKDPEVYPEGEITGFFGKKTKEALIRFQKKHLPESQETGATGKKTREKLNELCTPPTQEVLPLQITLITVNQSQLLQAANALKEFWKKIGAAVAIDSLDILKLKPLIKERSYEALLFGEALGSLPDPFPFWHSSQKSDPGLNLASYENKDVDKLLKEARETLDENQRKEKYEKAQDLLAEDAPALFLYSADYLYLISDKIKIEAAKKLIDPAKRFINVESWFIKTKRIFK